MKVWGLNKDNIRDKDVVKVNRYFGLGSLVRDV